MQTGSSMFTTGNEVCLRNMDRAFYDCIREKRNSTTYVADNYEYNVYVCGVG